MVILKQVHVQKHPKLWPILMLASLISKRNTWFVSVSKYFALLKGHNLTMNDFSFSVYLPWVFVQKPYTAQLTSHSNTVHTPIVTLTIVAELDTAPNHSQLLDKIFTHVCCFENASEYGNTYLLWPNQDILVWFSEHRLIQIFKFLTILLKVS